MRFAIAVLVVLAQTTEANVRPYTYSNEYFRISTDLPPDWKITTHKRSPISPEWRDIYQLHDADVPSRPGIGKVLFTASKGRAPYVDAKVEISCFKVDGEDMFARVVERQESLRAKQVKSPESTKYSAATILKLETGEWELDGLRFRFVDEVSGSASRVFHRFAFLEIPSKGWIELRVMGSDQKHFETALKIAGTLRRAGAGEAAAP